MSARARDPQEHREHDQAEHDPFVARHRAHACELFRRPFGDFGAALHLRPAHEIAEQRDEQHQDDAERREADEPLAPAHLDPDRLLGDRECRRIGRKRGEEQRARDSGRSKSGPHHIGADLAGGRSRLGAVDARDVADDGIDDAAAARGVGRCRRREQEIRHRHGITEAERIAAEALHQYERDAAAERALAIADREHEGADDQPHRAFGKSRQHPAQRLGRVRIDIATDASDGQPDQADRADRHRFQDQAGDDRREYCKIVPLVDVESRGNRPQIDREPHDERRDQFPAKSFRLRRLRAGVHGPSPSISSYLAGSSAGALLSLSRRIRTVRGPINGLT